MAVKLDTKDKKIINELWVNARQTDSAISKKVGLSREVVSYRIKQLEKKGIIKEYITLTDTAMLGYTTFNIYLRLKNFDLKKEKEIIDIISTNPYVKWLITLSGNHDFFFVMIARSRREFDQHLTELFSKFGDYISQSMVLNSVCLLKDVDFFFPINRPFEKIHVEETVEKQPNTEAIKLDKIDYHILSVISQNARMNVIDIARELEKRKVGMTPEAISYRLKRLSEQKIIRGYRVVLDFEKLGYLWYVLLWNLSMIPADFEKKLKEYLKQDDKIVYADKTFGNWNLRLEVLVKDHTEFHGQLVKLRNIFGEYLNTYELLLVFTDHTMVSFTKGIYEDWNKSP
jgi:Lrp/AsnC family transcriptional regulator, leucine-responsive regulatory protein